MKITFYFAALISFFSIATACNNNTATESKGNVTAITNEPKQLTYTITASYPHDPNSFTEGFEWRDGFLYEGTGDPSYSGKSKLLKVDLKTGKSVKEISLEKQFFGEGITLLNGKIYQMTYKEQKCFLYDATTFTKLKEFTYEGEGWGLTNDGKQLIMSNGSSSIFFRNPENFAVTKTLTVSNNYGPLSNINELELVDGFLYANLWTTKKIVKIDTASGKVIAEANFDDLLTKYASDINTEKVDVFNGIAYDPVGKRFFITGKYYPKVFEVKFN
jgi:glutamine cyclotransferase